MNRTAQTVAVRRFARVNPILLAVGVVTRAYLDAKAAKRCAKRGRA